MAAQLFQEEGQLREELNTSTNLFKILIDMGKLRDADQIRLQVQSNVEKLSTRDLFRGFYSLSVAYFFSDRAISMQQRQT